MINWVRVHDLREEIGEENFHEVVTLFLDEADEAVGRLIAARDDVVTMLHSLKGSALNLGFRELARLCAVAEIEAGAGSRPDLAALAACYAQSRAAFASGVGALAA